MTTPDAGVRSAQGEDRSSYQPILPWTGLDFGMAKATEGTDWYDPTFAANWANLAHAGIPRAAYHFLHPALDPIAQARWFITKVKAQGLKPGDMLVADVEILVGADGALIMSPKAASRSHLLTAGTNGRAFPRSAVIGRHEVATVSSVPVGIAAAAFLAEVRALAGPHNPVLCYTDLSVGASLGPCTAFDLWIAFYASTAPASVAPWKNWRIWQYAGGGGSGGSDRDGYNGTAAQLRAWIATYLPKPPPPPVTVPLEDDMPLITAGAKAVTPVVVKPGTAKTITFGSDNTLTLQPAPTLRIAWHSAANGWGSTVVTLPPSGVHTVTFSHADTDLVSVQRAGGNAGDDVPVGYLLG